MTNELTLENIRSGAFPSDAHAVGFLLGELEQLRTQMEILQRANRFLSEQIPHAPEPEAVAPFPYPTDRDGWICSVCHGWNGPKTRVCLHSHVPLDPQGASRDASSVEVIDLRNVDFQPPF